MTTLDFTEKPWEEYHWPGFDEVANDLAIGRNALPATAGVFAPNIVYDFEAPVGVKSSLAKEDDGYIIFVKWNEFCPCFSSPAAGVSDEFVAKIWQHLSTMGFSGPADLPSSGDMVYLSDAFIDKWRQDFFVDNPLLKMWKSNRVRRDEVHQPKCTCAPAVPNHQIIPPFRSPEGWSVNPNGAQVEWAPFFWMDPHP